ncbi:hypothetical protein [Microvirga makkahensis]|uniref:Uncharacterized protein n=1 Tax=Microvirga makkahensis TaxID=1128670 RepID=A0A7X3MVN0_9HYPH|nr:hypothetical protein [Microvirga makkahensis]MXQ13980.1 hypothetical protein [Microvirga makkahensis]
MNTPDHITRAQAVRSDLAPVAEALERCGCAVNLKIVSDRTLAAVLMSATFTGSPALAHKLVRDIRDVARAQGIDLDGIVCDHDDLRADQQRIGFVCLCPARKPSRKAA